MRQAIITAQLENGQWITLAHPDVPIQEQTAYLKQLKAENGVIQLDGRPVQLIVAQLLTLGTGKVAKFKVVEAQTGMSAPQSGELVANLDALAAALGLSRENLDELRKVDDFPLREKDGYDVAATREFLTAKAKAEADAKAKAEADAKAKAEADAQAKAEADAKAKAKADAKADAKAKAKADAKAKAKADAKAAAKKN